MRRDYLIAILLALAALPAGAALMVAPEYLHLTGIAIPITFWGGIGLAIALIVIAGVVAARGEAREPIKGHRWRLAFIIFAGLVLSIGGIGGIVWWRNQEPAGFVPPQGGPILESRAGKMLLMCSSSPGDKRAFEEWKKTFREAAVILGNATGYSIALSDVPKGIKIEIQAITSDAQAKMPGITKITIQAQRLTNQNVLAIYSWEMPGLFGQILEAMPLDVNAEQTKQAIKQVEQLINANKCQVV